MWRQHRRDRKRFYFFVFGKRTAVCCKSNNGVRICACMTACARYQGLHTKKASTLPPKYQESLDSISLCKQYFRDKVVPAQYELIFPSCFLIFNGQETLKKKQSYCPPPPQLCYYMYKYACAPLSYILAEKKHDSMRSFLCLFKLKNAQLRRRKQPRAELTRTMYVSYQVLDKKPIATAASREGELS